MNNVPQTNAPEAAPSMPPPPPSPPKTVLYYVLKDGVQQGPYTEAALQVQIEAGTLPADVLVWTEGMPEWQVCSHVFSNGNTSQEDAKKEDQAKGAAMKAVTKVDAMVGDISGLEKLEGFSWKNFFSAVFRKHSDEEVHEIFNCGGEHNTPSLDQISPAWPTPWLFTRMLAYGIAVALLFWYGEERLGNIRLFPGYILFAALAVPFAVFILFYELNIRRDVSLYNAQRCLIGGGAGAILYTLLTHSYMSNNGLGMIEHLLGAMVAGPIEEVAKLYAALMVIKLFKIKNVRILTGVFIGCAVGAGFAIFETAGYIFEAAIPNIFFLCAEGMFSNAPAELQQEISRHIVSALGENWNPGSFQFTAILRGLLAPFCHVVWSAVVVGAFFRVSNMRAAEKATKFEWKNIDWMTVVDKRFLKIALFPVIFHMIWNSGDAVGLLIGDGGAGFLYMLVVWPLLGLIAWILALRMVQSGINQVRQEKAEYLTAEKTPSEESIPEPDVPSHATEP